jgi:4-hydroxy-tetrahydrodipicolinate synthase
LTQLQLAGAIPANILTYRPDHSIDEVEYRRHIEWLASCRGVGGITCNGHAAEVSTLSREERRRMVALTAEVVNGRVPVISGVYAESFVQAIEYARDARDEGAAAILVFPLNVMLFGGNPEMAYEHFARLADALDQPMVAFVYPAWTRMQLPSELLVRICEDIPNVVAVKEWSLDIAVYERNLRALRSLQRPVAMLTSFSTHLLPSMVVGADGVLSGHGSVIADLQAELLDLVHGGEMQRAHQLYDRIQKLTAVIYREPFADMYTRMKEHLVMLGRLERSLSRPPMLPLGERERQELRAALVDAELLTPASVA